MKTTMKYLTGAIFLGMTHLAMAAAPCDDAQKQCSTQAKATCKAAKCDASSGKGLTNAHYMVTGMVCKGCSGSITKKLAAIDGVSVKKVCHESGSAIVDYDPKKVNKDAIKAALNQGKFKVTAERVSVPVKGMTCGKCSEKLTAALNGVDGVSANLVCHKSGKAVVDIDCAKSCRDTVVKTIQKAGFKAE
ncbi:MAG: cation transporter [Verrucomicrobiae bacterium]|nr:cation transporter [Verrucomicrobiae bacterium]NNJ42999.1 heavy-metal-associated domain-containing protein [Akkermansiaceae bacterium]